MPTLTVSCSLRTWFVKMLLVAFSVCLLLLGCLLLLVSVYVLIV